MDRTARILIVDANAASRQVYAEALRGEGYDASEAASGQQGFELAQQWHPDIVLLGATLPDPGKAELCHRIQADPALADILIVMLPSGVAFARTSERTPRGTEETESKSVGLQDLLVRLRAATLVAERRTPPQTRASKHLNLLEILPDAVALTDLQGRILRLNSRVVQRLGYARPQELLGKTLFDLILPVDHERLRADLARVLQNDEPLTAVYFVFRKDGQPFPAEMSAAVLRGENGQAEGLIITGRDITEHQKMIQALEAEEAKFRTLIQGLPAVTWLSDETGATNFISDNVEGVYGFTPAEIYRGGEAAWLGRIHPDDRPGVQAQYHALFRGEGFDVEYRYQHKDGHWVWVNDRSVSVFEQNGSRYARGFFIDITERKRAENLLVLQHEVGARLACSSDLRTALEGLLEIAVQVGGIDCGGAYLLDPATGGIDLVAHRGLSAAFASTVSHAGSDSPQVRRMQQGRAMYDCLHRFPDAPEFAAPRKEGLRVDAIIPFQHEGRLVGGLALASHTADDIPHATRFALETIATQAAGGIARVQAEQALRASEERYRTLAESSPDAIFIMGKGSKVQYVNSAAAALWGCAPQEMLGLGQSDLFPPQTARHQAEVIEGVFVSGKSEMRQEAIPFPSGTRWLETRLTPICAPNGSVVSVMGVTRDITERKNAETLLRVQLDLGIRLGSTSDLKLAMDGLLEIAIQIGGIDCGGVHLVNKDSGSIDLVAHLGLCPAFVSRIAHWDADTPQAQLMREGQLVYTSFAALPTVLETPEERDEGLRAVAIVPLKHEGNLVGSLVLASHTADDIPIDKRVALEAIAAQAADAVVRIRAEGSLRASEHHHRRLVEVMPDTVAMLDLDGRILSINPSGAEMLGYFTPDQILGKSIYDLTHAEDHERIRADLARLLRDRVLRNNEYRAIQRLGMIIPVDCSATLIQDTKGQPTGLIVVARGIAERKRAERQRVAFAELGRRLSGQTEAESTAAAILDVALGLFGWDAGYVHLYSKAQDKVLPLITFDTINGQRTILARDSQPHPPTPLMRLVMIRGARLLHYDDPALQGVDLAPFGDTSRPSATRLYAPIRSGGAAIGVLSIQSYTLGAYSNDDLELFQAMADYCGDALDRIRAVEALREAEASYRSIFENATEGIFRTTPAGRIISANPSLARMFGYESSEQMMAGVGSIARDLYVSPEHRATFKQLLQEHGVVQGFEVENRRKDGSRLWISLNARTVRDANGSVLYYEGTIQDITERRHTEESLRRSQELQQAILENISDPAWLKDTEGRFLVCSQAMASVAGRPACEIVGRTLQELVPADANRSAAEDAQVVTARKQMRFESRWHTPRGSPKWFEVLKTPLLDAQGAVIGIVGVARDVTERKHFEEQLVLLPRRIIETQEAERQRVARELHDSVNQLLASIRMRLGRVSDISTSIGPSAREVLKRCQDLLVQAIEENRRIAHDLRPTDLDQLGFTLTCRNFCRQFAARSGLRIKCSIGRFGERLPTQVELNLFRIVQEAFNNVERHARARTISTRVMVRDNSLRLKIIDDGCGFDPAAVSTGKKKSRFGLLNLRERAAAMRGSCEIESVPGHGTTITVTVPLKKRR